MKKQTLTKKQQKALLDIAKRLMWRWKTEETLKRAAATARISSRFPSGASRKPWRKPTFWARRRSKPDTASTKGAQMQVNKLPQPNRTSPTQGLCGGVVGQRRNEYERRKSHGPYRGHLQQYE